MERGYHRLLSFECLNPQQSPPRLGYEWFGGTAPPHEALTAYGLMLFRDLTRVYDQVDRDMLQRTRQFLLSRKDGKGGFQRNARGLDGFGHAPEPITNAYIVWALTENSKEDDLEKELAALVEQAGGNGDSYFLALVANSLLSRGRADEARVLLQKLMEAQTAEGFVDGAKASITRSRGRDLQIETTALAVLAWLKAEPPGRQVAYRKAIQAAARWIGQQRGGYGGYGATQATILALKAFVALERSNKAVQAGEVVLYFGDRAVSSQRFPAGAHDVITLGFPEAEKYLKSGKNQLRLEMAGDNEFPYTLTWAYRTIKPPGVEDCPINLLTKLDRSAANEGDTVRLTATVQNRYDEDQGMTVAIIGLPAGLTLPEDMKQLKDLARPRNDGKEPGVIGAWETRGRELLLYWRSLAPNQKVEVNLDLICRVPGEYRGPASRAYLYYNADKKCWVDPLSVSIQAVQGQ